MRGGPQPLDSWGVTSASSTCSAGGRSDPQPKKDDTDAPPGAGRGRGPHSRVGVEFGPAGASKGGPRRGPPFSSPLRSSDDQCRWCFLRDGPGGFCVVVVVVGLGLCVVDVVDGFGFCRCLSDAPPAVGIIRMPATPAAATLIITERFLIIGSLPPVASTCCGLSLTVRIRRFPAQGASPPGATGVATNRRSERFS